MRVPKTIKKQHFTSTSNQPLWFTSHQVPVTSYLDHEEWIKLLKSRD